MLRALSKAAAIDRLVNPRELVLNGGFLAQGNQLDRSWAQLYPPAADLAFPRAGVRPLFDLFRLLHPQERTFMAMPPFVCF